MDAEAAHEFGIKALKGGLASPFYVADRTFGLAPTTGFGLTFTNPLGVAAGFDKNGVVVDQLASLGFGFVEVGTVTLETQTGNSKPRLFRLPDDKALINRLGFNNDGARVVAERLAKLDRKCVVGVNIGKNKDVPNEQAIANFVGCLEIVHPVADYIVVNVSSPNTPGLRDLQRPEHLSKLLNSLQDANAKLGRKPLLVKIAPDVTDSDLLAMLDTLEECAIDGIVATNTTVAREGPIATNAGEEGGLSGRPLFQRSNDLLAILAGRTRLPVIGVGGIFSGKDAFDKIEAGATLIQAYTGFIYGGPAFPREVLQELARLLTLRNQPL